MDPHAHYDKETNSLYHSTQLVRSSMPWVPFMLWVQSFVATICNQMRGTALSPNS